MRAVTVRRRVARALASALLLLGAATGVAWAHARLVRSTPAANAHVARPPAELRLEFSETVSARTSRIELVGPDSQRMSLALQGDSSDVKVLVASVPALAITGRYGVDWRLVGPDGHAVTGRYSFTVDSLAVAAPDDTIPAGRPPGAMDAHEPPADSVLERSIRFATSLSMVIIIGAIVFALFVLPGATQSDPEARAAFRSRSEQRLRAFAVVGAGSLLLVAIVRLVSHGILLSGSASALRWGDITGLIAGTTFGFGWLLQSASALALLAGLRSRRPRWKVLAAAAVGAAVSAPFLGHPAAVPDVAALAMGLDAVHVLAAGGWAGAIVMLLIVLPNVSAVPSTNRVELCRDLLRSFSPLALASATVVVLTGVIGGWLQLRDPALVLGSDYGMMLVRKVVVVLIIAALGAYHWKVVQPTIGSDRSVSRLRLSVALDVSFVLVLLVITALLTGTTPPVR